MAANTTSHPGPYPDVDWVRHTKPGVHFLATVYGRQIRVSRHLSGNGWRWQHRLADNPEAPWAESVGPQNQYNGVDGAMAAALENLGEG